MRFDKSLFFLLFLFTVAAYGQTAKFTLTWDLGTESNLQKYLIFRSNSPNASSLVDSVPYPTTQYVDNSVQKGRLYYYRLKVENDTLVTSDFSQEVSAAYPKISGLKANITLRAQHAFFVDLDTVVTDPDNADNTLTWAVTGNTVLEVTITNRVATIIAPAGWNSPETLVFSVHDNKGFDDQASMVVDVGTGTGGPSPVINNLPDISFNVGANDSLQLNNYVSDADNADKQLEWSSHGSTNTIVNINSNTHVATFSAVTDWTGSENVWMVVKDPDDNKDSSQIKITVKPMGFPIINNLPDISFIEGAEKSIQLDRYVSDPNDAVDQLVWSSHGSIKTIVNINSLNRVATFSAIAGWAGSENVWMVVTDPDNNKDSTRIKITVIPQTTSEQVKVNVFPVPYRASQDNTGDGINFTGLPLNAKIEVYNILGELVFRKDNEGGGETYSWKLKNSSGKDINSGLYIYIVKDDKNEKKASGKIVIVQ